MQRGFRASLFGLGTAVCFASSSIFIRYGLEDLPSPLVGVTIGMLFCALVYGLVLLLRRAQDRGDDGRSAPLSREIWLLQITAGVLVGVATWWRWIALDRSPIAVVITLGRLNIPVVLLLSPLIIGRRAEQVTPRLWLGAGLVVAGSLVLTFYG